MSYAPERRLFSASGIGMAGGPSASLGRHTQSGLHMDGVRPDVYASEGRTGGRVCSWRPSELLSPWWTGGPKSPPPETAARSTGVAERFDAALA